MTETDPAVVALPRSLLYVPAHRQDLFAKAATGPADAIVLDLEDAVPVEAKTLARANVVAWLRDPSHVQQCRTWVRVDSRTASVDLAAAAWPGLAGLMVAKVGRTALDNAHEVLSALENERGLPQNSIRAIGLVEDAATLENLAGLTEHPRLRTLGLGEADLFADLRLTRTAATAAAIDSLRLRVVTACAAAGLDAPVAPTSISFRDLEQLTASTQALKALGFRSRTAIHPKQVPVINEVFTPTAEELAAAERTIAALEAAAGAATSDGAGQLIDAALARTARETVSRRR